MAKSYRTQMTPGMKECIDHMRGNKVKKEGPKIKNVPSQVQKLKNK